MDHTIVNVREMGFGRHTYITTLLLTAAAVALCSPAYAKKHKNVRAPSLVMPPPPKLAPVPVSNNSAAPLGPQKHLPSWAVASFETPQPEPAPKPPAFMKAEDDPFLAHASLREDETDEPEVSAEFDTDNVVSVADREFVLALKAGGMVAGGVGTSPTGGIELGYLVPLFDKRLQIFGSLAYAAPGRNRSIQTNALPGTANAQLSTKQLWLDLGILLRARPLESNWNLYGVVAAAVLAQDLQNKTTLNGAVIGSARDGNVGVGAKIGAGGEYAVGPGRLLVEATYTAVNTSSIVSGPVTNGGIALQAGYRWFF